MPTELHDVTPQETVIFVHTRFFSLEWLCCKAFHLVKLVRGHISVLIALVALRNVLFILMQRLDLTMHHVCCFFKKPFTCSCSLRSNVDPFSVKCSHFMQMRIQQPFAGHLLLILKVTDSNYGLPIEQVPCFVSYSGDREFELRTAQRLGVCLLFWWSWPRVTYGPEISCLIFHFFWVDSSDPCRINRVTPSYEVTKHYLLSSH